jgi:hypothetical protein
MDDQIIDKMAQYLATEYSMLQDVRNMFVVFLTTISAGIVALALVFNISQFGEAFLLFALVLIPVLGFIGISAYVRMTQLDLADFVYTSAINRIRHYYLQTTPEIEQYISFPASDDERGFLRARVIYTSNAWFVLSYPSIFILVINSVLAGAWCSLLIAALFQAQVLLAAGTGVVVFLLVGVLQYRLGMKWYADVRKDFKPRFPEPASSTRPQV